jgi:hypothetical protein
VSSKPRSRCAAAREALLLTILSGLVVGQAAPTSCDPPPTASYPACIHNPFLPDDVWLLPQDSLYIYYGYALEQCTADQSLCTPYTHKGDIAMVPPGACAEFKHLPNPQRVRARSSWGTIYDPAADRYVHNLVDCTVFPAQCPLVDVTQTTRAAVCGTLDPQAGRPSGPCTHVVSID